MKSNQRLIILQPNVRLVDPHTNTDDKNTLSLLSNVFESLVKVNSSGGYEPALARCWEVSSDARHWTFHLRHPVYFHHGEMLTSMDVVESFNRILNPDNGGELGTKGIYHGYLGGATITSVDDFTVQLITPTPMADLLDFLAKFSIAPRNGFKDLPGRMIGTGPYNLTSAKDGQVVMAAFDDYWGGKPIFKQLVWEAEPDSERRVEALVAGKVDLISEVEQTGRELILASGHVIQLVSRESSVCTVFMCNHSRGICKDRKIRQALNYGVDKDELIRTVMMGAARPLNGPLTSKHFGYNPASRVYPYDPQKAKTLLADAGYPDGVEFVVDVPHVLPDEAIAVAQGMAAQYQRIGIRTVVRDFADRPKYAEMVRNKEIDDACCFDSSPLSTFQVLSDKFHSRLHGAWWQGYQNDQVDALIDEAQATPNEQRRKAIYQQAYELLNQDAPWIFLYNPILTWAVGPAAEGFEPTGDNLIRLR